MSDLEKIVEEHLRGGAFAEALAREVASAYGQKLFDEFGNEIAEAMHKQVKEMSKRFVEDFAVESDVQRLVADTFQRITKQELLEVLTPPVKPQVKKEVK